MVAGVQQVTIYCPWSNNTLDNYDMPAGSSTSCCTTTHVQPEEHTSSKPQNEQPHGYSGPCPTTMLTHPRYNKSSSFSLTPKHQFQFMPRPDKELCLSPTRSPNKLPCLASGACQVASCTLDINIGSTANVFNIAATLLWCANVACCLLMVISHGSSGSHP